MSVNQSIKSCRSVWGTLPKTTGKNWQPIKTCIPANLSSKQFTSRTSWATIHSNLRSRPRRWARWSIRNLRGLTQYSQIKSFSGRIKIWLNLLSNNPYLKTLRSYWIRSKEVVRVKSKHNNQGGRKWCRCNRITWSWVSSLGVWWIGFHLGGPGTTTCICRDRWVSAPKTLRIKLHFIH